MKTILFRTDSSSIIGTGHIMRDLVLATRLEKKYPNTKIFFATQNLECNINTKIEEAGYEILPLMSGSKDELHELLKAHKIELLVIDNYGIDYAYEKALKKINPTLTLMTLDDTYEKHACDILLNHNIYADPKKYGGLVPKHCELQCGGKYTLLRDEFYKTKKSKTKKSNTKKSNTKIKEKTVFLAMGGADHSHINIKILQVLKKFKNLHVNLATTSANKNLKGLQKYVKNKKWITLHINANNVAELMQESDFGIITPSVTANEMYFMEIPFVSIQTIENQKYMHNFLARNRNTVLKKFKVLKLIQAVRRFT
jgi:UDP-2,4-diacetamido-2,4,6-trideoxy-beta-L-altropyranose hydrolase